MGDEWQEVPLGEFVRLQRGHDLTSEERRPGNIPVMGSAGQNGWHDTAKAPGPGVVIGRSGVGSMGAVHYCAVPFWPHNTTLYVTDFLGNDPLFACFLLRTLNLRRYDSGSAQSSLNRNNLYNVPILRPPLAEQRTIASILGALDDKIELNRKMNATLEAIARALFKSWFVDFDPVRAKAEGRAPSGMDAETAKLFPSEFVDSEFGLIPKGWELSTLARYAALNSESWSRSTYPASIRYVDLSNTKWGTIEAITPFERETAPSRAQRVLRPGDTIVGTVRPANGSFAIVAREGLTGSTGFAVLRPRKANTRAFIYCAATTAENIDRLAHLADGGAYPAVRPELVVQTAVAGAPDEVLARFEAAVVGNMDRIASSRAESATLARLRDELLPRLLSGELPVDSGERAVEEVA